MASDGNSYNGLPANPGYSYSYEQQTNKPVDGTNSFARLLSPFTIRFVLPELIGAKSGVDVNLIGRASRSNNDSNSASNQVRESFGLPSVNSGSSQLVSVRAEYSAGQALSNKSSLTTRAVVTDAATLSDIKYQIEKLLSVPPLTLLVNPNNMVVSYSSVQNFSDLTRAGYVFQRWGEEQISISFSGTTGAFTAGSNVASSLSASSVGPNGVQFASKRDSAAFQNFVSLYQIYRHNGYIYDTLGKTQAMLMVGSVAIDYDQFTYVGNIENFKYGYETDSPNMIKWEMEFKVGRMYDHSSSPVVVLPQSGTSTSPGSPTLQELTTEISRNPTRNSIESAGGYLEVSGTRQISQTPIQALTPSGLVR